MWNSVYVPLRRWAGQGLWDALLQRLVDLGLTDEWQHMIDSTSVRGHVSAAGGKGRLVRMLVVDHAAASRTRPAPDAGPRACEAHYHGLPFGFILFGDEASDYAAAEPLVEIPITATKTLLAENG